MRARSSIRTANWAAIGSSPLATRPADHSAWALLAAPVALPAGVLSDASNPPICVNEPISVLCMAWCPGGRQKARRSTERVALCAYDGWRSLRVKIHLPRSSVARPTRPRPTNGLGASGPVSCGTQRCTKTSRSRWVSSSSGNAVSTPAPLASLGAWGDVGGQVAKTVGMRVMIRCGLRRWDGLVLFLGDSRIEMDGTNVERAMRA
jgi:hypothetical protein